MAKKIKKAFYMIRTIPDSRRPDLIFEDPAQVKEWLMQPFVSDKTHKVSVGHETRGNGRWRCPDCGDKPSSYYKIVRTMKVSEFVKECGESDGGF